MQEYDSYCFLSTYEMEQLEQLKKIVSKFNLYCTFLEFDRFLNNVLMMGHCSDFIEAFKCFAKENPADNYLLKCGRFSVATIERSSS